MRPFETSFSISGICVSTPGKPQSACQITSLVFSSTVWGAWSVAIMSTTPDCSAAQIASESEASRTGGLTRMIEPSRA